MQGYLPKVPQLVGDSWDSIPDLSDSEVSALSSSLFPRLPILKPNAIPIPSIFSSLLDAQIPRWPPLILLELDFV